MKSKFFIIALAATMLLACKPNDPELTERNRLIGEWERLDEPNQPAVIISDSQIIVMDTIAHDTIVHYYNLIKPGRLYVHYERVYIDELGDEYKINWDLVSPYEFNLDTLTIKKLFLPDKRHPGLENYYLQSITLKRL